MNGDVAKTHWPVFNKVFQFHHNLLTSDASYLFQPTVYDKGQTVYYLTALADARVWTTCNLIEPNPVMPLGHFSPEQLFHLDEKLAKQIYMQNFQKVEGDIDDGTI